MVTVIIVSNISYRMAGHILSEGEIEETVINLLSSTTEDEVLELRKKSTVSMKKSSVAISLHCRTRLRLEVKTAHGSFSA